MELKERVLKDLRERRERVLKGLTNSIPSPFKRFQNDFIGIEQGKYYLLTGGTKSSKTQLGSFLFIYTPLLYAYQHPEKIRLKIFYYNLEESKDDILIRFMCYLLYTKNNIRISSNDLKSIKEGVILDEAILNLLDTKAYTDIIDFFEQTVIFGDSANPTGIYLESRRYLENHGTVHKKSEDRKDEYGMPTKVEVFDYYEPADPDEYRILFIDHVSLLSTERGQTLKQTIDKLSEYCVKLRNRYKITPVVIQQQSLEQEGLEAHKSNRMKPTLAGLSDSKYTSRDVNIALGIFSPFRCELPEYKGYDIRVLKDRARFLEVLINRGGSPGGMIALYFDGAVNFFKELPNAQTQPEELLQVYKLLTKKPTTLLAVRKNLKKHFSISIFKTKKK